MSDESRSENTQAPAGGDRAKGNRRHPSRHHNRKGQRRFYAALDLGTNNCRLLIVEHDGNDGFLVRDGHHAPKTRHCRHARRSVSGNY